MLAYIKGKIIAKTDSYVIIENNGLGYKVSVPLSLLVNANKQEEMECFLYHHIREDNQQLFGFSDLDSLRWFEQLISVNGIGPKIGMAILSRYNVKELQEIIEQENVNAIKSISGVGQKTALRLMIELKNKIPHDSGENNYTNELVEALKNLGFDTKNINQNLQDMPELATLQEQIKWFLKNNQNR